MITEMEFDQGYVPLENEGGWLLREYDEVKDHDVSHVWTIVEDDGSTENLYALPGFHVVNCVGYVVTERPWVSGDEVAVYIDVEEAGHAP